MPAAQPSPKGRPKPLSRREQMVLTLMTEGMTNPEIANSLDLAPSTVKTYVSSILWKLECALAERPFEQRVAKRCRLP
jgi:LuxR family transcriptional regulator, maltose regulon positive regulatory protein